VKIIVTLRGEEKDCLSCPYSHSSILTRKHGYVSMNGLIKFQGGGGRGDDLPCLAINLSHNLKDNILINFINMSIVMLSGGMRFLPHPMILCNNAQLNSTFSINKLVSENHRGTLVF
jgi:hypothetical protein